MNENTSEDGDFLDDTLKIQSDDEAVPNFAFHCLKDDPSIQYHCNADDPDGRDINDYLDKALLTNLENLEFKWKSECLLCAEFFEEYQDLLDHCIRLHKNEFEEFACTLQDCATVIKSEELLARHLVLRHADLGSIKIYVCCPYCDFRSSSFTQLNKHSCYRKLTRKACIQPYCQYCKEEFVSHKRFVFHLQFHLAKRRSKICLICNASFNDVDAFFVHVNYAHEPPGTMACKICDRIFTRMEAFDAHQKMHKLKPKYKCNECSKSYYDKRFLTQHKENVHVNAEFKCDECWKIFPTYPMLQNHMKWHKTVAEVLVHICTNCGLIGRDAENLKTHNSNPSTECFECNIEEEMLITAFSCIYCSQDFKDKDSLRKHRAAGTHEDGKYICPLCNKTFKDLKAKRLHLPTHEDYKSWLESLPPLKRSRMCDVGDCDECYFEWSALYRHKTRIHEATTCRNCNQTFTNVDELQNHLQECVSNRHVCQFCNKICPTKMSLAIHVARSHNTKNVSCSQCSRVLKDEQALQKHIDVTHVAAICELCDKRFSSKRVLASHIKAIHEKLCRYFCSYCDKGFYFRSQRDSHEEASHPESSYKCGTCNYETKYAKSLEIHVAKHINKEQLLCPYCSKMFGRSNSLKMHMKLHENDKPFRCCDTIVDGCDASYITLSLLNNHIKSKHANQWDQKPKNKKTPAKLKLTKTNRRKTKTSASTSTAVENQNETESNIVYAETVEKTAESNPSQIYLSSEELIDITNNAANYDGENYMLLLVDDIDMPIVNNVQVLGLENADDNAMVVID